MTCDGQRIDALAHGLMKHRPHLPNWPCPVPFEGSMITTLVTLLALESLRDGQPLSVDLAALLTRLET